MGVAELVFGPALPRAVVVGVFGGAGLVLTTLYTRRGPLIYIPYAALLAVLGLLLTRYAELPFTARFVAVIVGFLTASAPLYVATGILAARGRRRLVEQGRLPSEALSYRLPLLGHAWRIGFLVGIGAVASAGVAFVAG